MKLYRLQFMRTWLNRKFKNTIMVFANKAVFAEDRKASLDRKLQIKQVAFATLVLHPFVNGLHY